MSITPSKSNPFFYSQSNENSNLTFKNNNKENIIEKISTSNINDEFLTNLGENLAFFWLEMAKNEEEITSNDITPLNIQSILATIKEMDKEKMKIIHKSFNSKMGSLSESERVGLIKFFNSATNDDSENSFFYLFDEFLDTYFSCVDDSFNEIDANNQKNVYGIFTEVLFKKKDLSNSNSQIPKKILNQEVANLSTIALQDLQKTYYASQNNEKKFKRKIYFLEELENLNIARGENLNRLQMLLKNKGIKEEQKFKNFKIILEFDDKNCRTHGKLFKKTIEKLKRLKNKIDSQDLTNLDNMTPADEASLVGIEKNERRLEKYAELKKTWFESLLKYRKYEDLLDKAYFTITILSKVTGFCEKLQEQKEYLDTFNNYFENISPHNLFEKPKDDFYTNDLPKNMENIKTYKDSLIKFIEVNKTINMLNESMKTFLPEIKYSFKKIFSIIETIEKADDDEILNLVDTNMKKLMKKQKQESISNLHLLINEIEQSWNRFCLNLNEVKHRVNSFSSVKNITEKMHCVLLLAQSIRYELRKLRKYEDSRAKHIEVFKVEKAKYDQLRRLFLKSYDSLNVKGVETILNDPLEVEKASLFSKQDNISLNDEYQKLLNLIRDDSYTSRPAKSIGLVWASKDQKKEIIDSCNLQQTIFNNELFQDTHKLCLAYNKIFEITTEEVEREKEVLANTPENYNNNFTKAFYVKYSPYLVMETMEILKNLGFNRKHP